MPYLGHPVMSYPPGYRFAPTEEELVFYYLRKKIENKPLPPGVIEEVELYGEKNPWEIFKNDSTGYFYVFTQLKRRKKRKRNDVVNGDGDESVRFDRTAGIGTWKGRQCNNKDDRNSLTTWFKKDFIFEVRGNTKNFDHGRWIMMELSLPQCEDYVVCRIYNKGAKPKAQHYGSHNYDEDENETPLALQPVPLQYLYQPMNTTTMNPLPPLLEYQAHLYFSRRNSGVYRLSPPSPTAQQFSSHESNTNLDSFDDPSFHQFPDDWY